MFSRVSNRPLLAFLLLSICCVTSSAVAQWGPGQPGGDFAGYGGGFGGYGGYGMGGYGGMYGGYNGYYGGYYSGIPGFGYGSYGSAQPLYSSFNQPNYSVYRQPLYTTPMYSLPAYNQPIILRQFGSTTGRTYSGSTPRVTSSGVNISNVSVSASRPVYDQGEIVLFSPPSNNQDVQYTLNGAPYTMKPGTVQKFTNDRTWTIETRLGSGQVTRYTLATGRYKFKETETGMNLYTTEDSPETPVAAPADDSAAEVPAPSPMPVD